MVMQEGAWLCRRGHGCAGGGMVMQEGAWLCRRGHGYAGGGMVMQEGPWLCRSHKGFNERIVWEMYSISIAMWRQCDSVGGTGNTPDGRKASS